jgi:hypothetical protein
MLAEVLAYRESILSVLRPLSTSCFSLASATAGTPVLAMPLKGGDAYYMLNDFNHHHHHAVLGERRLSPLFNGLVSPAGAEVDEDFQTDRLITSIVSQLAVAAAGTPPLTESP